MTMTPHMFLPSMTFDRILPFLLLLSILLFSFSTPITISPSPLPTNSTIPIPLTVLWIASFVNFTSTNAPFFTDYVEASSQLPLQNFLLSLTFPVDEWYAKQINAIGGIPLHDANNTHMEIQFKYLNLHFGYTDEERYDEELLLSQQIANGTYGLIQIIIQHDAMYPQLFSTACEPNKCLVVIAQAVLTSSFSCVNYNEIPYSLSPSELRTLTPSGDVLGCEGKRVGYRRFSNQLSSDCDFSNIYESSISIWKQLGESQIGMLVGISELDQSIASQSVVTINDFGMSVVFYQILDPSTLWAESDVDALIQSLNDSGVKVLMWITISDSDPIIYLANFISFLRGMIRNEYSPNIFTAFNDWLLPSILPADAIPAVDFLWQISPWSNFSRGSDFRAYNTPTNLELYPTVSSAQDSPQVFSDIVLADPFLAQFGYSNPLILPLALFTVNLLYVPQKIIESSQSPNVADWLTASQTLYAPSQAGLLRFDNIGRLQIQPQDIIVFQSLHELTEQYVVAPSSIGKVPIWPTPTWSERVYINQSSSDPNHIVIQVITSVSISFFVLLSLWIYSHRDTHLVKSASPKFLFLFLLGNIFLMVSVMCSSVDYTDQLCASRIWLLCIGFDCFIWPLILKTYRLCMIWHSSHLFAKKLTDILLLQGVLLFILIGIIINTIWISLGGMSAYLVTPDIYRPSNNFHQCATSSTDTVFIYISIALRAVYLALAAILVWFAKDLQGVWNESKALFSTLYCCFIISIIVSALLGSQLLSGGDKSSAVLNYYILNVGILIVCWTAVMSFIFPRLQRKKQVSSFFDTSSTTPGMRIHNINGNGHGNVNGVVPLALPLTSPSPMPLPSYKRKMNPNPNSPHHPDPLSQHQQNQNQNQMNQNPNINIPNYIPTKQEGNDLLHSQKNANVNANANAQNNALSHVDNANDNIMAMRMNVDGNGNVIGEPVANLPEMGMFVNGMILAQQNEIANMNANTNTNNNNEDHTNTNVYNGSHSTNTTE